jgi:hypothetical protein
VTTYWWCLVCEEHGQYTQHKTGASGQAHQHTTTTGHATTTSLHPKPDKWGYR